MLQGRATGNSWCTCPRLPAVARRCARGSRYCRRGRLWRAHGDRRSDRRICCPWPGAKTNQGGARSTMSGSSRTAWRARSGCCAPPRLLSQATTWCRCRRRWWGCGSRVGGAGRGRREPRERASARPPVGSAFEPRTVTTTASPSLRSFVLNCAGPKAKPRRGAFPFSS